MSKRCNHNSRLNLGALWLAAFETESPSIVEGNARIGAEPYRMSCLCCGCVVAATSAISHCCGGSGRNRRPVLLDLKRGALFCSACSSFLGTVSDSMRRIDGKRSKKSMTKYRKTLSAAENVLIRRISRPLRTHDGLPIGLRGLVNLGSTCFANSVLQALLQAQPLAMHFLSDKHSSLSCSPGPSESDHGELESSSDSERKHCMACAFDRLCREVYSGERKPYAPSDFILDWWCWAGSHAGSLATYQQQDAHEFYLSVLSALHTALSHPQRGDQDYSSERRDTRGSPGRLTNGFHSPCIPGSPLSHENPSWQPFAFGGEASVITSCFSGVLRSDVTCGECKLTSTNFDPCLDISLELLTENGSKGSHGPEADYGGCTLQKSLANFTSEEKLCFGEKYYCHWCKGPRTSMKQMSISKLQPIICMHIKRFEYTFSQQKFTKLDGYISFPLHSLNMRPYLSNSVLAKQDKKNKAKSNGDTDFLYDLYSVISHSGRLTGGHYIVYIRVAGSWYCCDDAWVTRVDEKDVANCQAYLLFYIQRNVLN